MKRLLIFIGSLFLALALAMLTPAVGKLAGAEAQTPEQSQSNQTTSGKQELPVAVPELSEIIPLSTKLYGRLAVLENTLTGVLDVSEIQKKFEEIEANLKVPAEQLQQIKASKVYRGKKLIELKDQIEQENELFEDVSKPLSKGIDQLGTWRKEWLAEKKLWNEWESSILIKGDLPQLKPTFEKANETIDTALNLVIPKLEEMLTVQEQAGTVQKKIESLTAEMNNMIKGRKRRFLLEVSPSMFSSQYFSQFGSNLWYEVQKGIDEIQWPNKRFFDKHGERLFLQGFLAIVLIIALYRNRMALLESKRWRFLGEHPFAAGFFVAIMMILLFYREERMPATMELGNIIVGGISFILLFRCLIAAPWKRHFAYGLITVFIINKLLYVVNLPLPLIRLYVLCSSLGGVFFCLRLARKSISHDKAGNYTRLLRLGSLFFAFIMIAEFWGKTNLPMYLFSSLIESATIILVYIFFMYMIQGAWNGCSAPLLSVEQPC